MNPTTHHSLPGTITVPSPSQHRATTLLRSYKCRLTTYQHTHIKQLKNANGNGTQKTSPPTQPPRNPATG